MNYTGLLDVFLGINLALAMMLVVLTLCVKRQEYWLAFLSNTLAALYCLFSAESGADASETQLLIATSIGAALFSFPMIWKDMLFKVTHYSIQWTFLILLISSLVLNQVFFKHSFILLLPSVMVSLMLMVSFIHQYGSLLSRLTVVSDELEKKNFAVGFDVSSSLPNKNAFSERVDKWLYMNSTTKLNVIAFKFTRFGDLNQLIGHNNADLVKLQLITRIKKRISKMPEVILLSDLSDDAYFASVGGVGFVTAVREDISEYATENVLNLLKNCVNEPLVVDSTAVDIGIEFGVSSFPEQATAIDNLIENAFLALSNSRHDNGSIYFNSEQQTRLLTCKTTIGQLKEDVANHKFSVFVQPQVDLKTRQVVGGELLVRWNREGEGLIKAEDFIALAEQSGIIYSLNMWTIEKAIQALASLKSEGLTQSLSINLANRELLQSHLVESILNLLEEYMIKPEFLIVEIKESAFAENMSKALKVARLLQQAGVKVAIDDFGKDRSAIATFNHFTPHYLKVDCRHIASNKRGNQLNTYTNAIIGMAKSLQIPVVAQGIETQETESQLLDLDCEFGQGFFYSKPFDLSGFDVWLEQWNRKLDS